MVETISKLLKMDIEAIIASPLCLELQKCYSILYLNGGQPRTCARSLRAYYTELAKTGYEMATKYSKAMERTNVPNWDGLRYIWGDFYSNTTLTDEQAITLLKNKGLSESDFKVLPDGYKSKSEDKPENNQTPKAPSKPRSKK